MNASTGSGSAVSRRGFLGFAAAAASLPLLAACGGSGGSASGAGGTTLKVWDMPWGPPEYTKAAQTLVDGYSGPDGTKATYQSTQWANYYQTFASAVASKTGPAVSSGGGFQAFQFADQGAIAYADDLVGSLKKSGAYDDFLPGTFDSLKTDKGYVAVPWQLDMRVLSYRKSLLEKAGVEAPTDWDSFITAGKALKKIGVIGYGTATGAGALLGEQSILAMMINNGGGLFAEDGKPDCVTDRNIETLQFYQQLSREGIIDPAAVSYTSANLNSDWKAKKVGMGFSVPSLRASLDETDDDIQVASPLTGPHGDKGTLYYVNNLMMYSNTPSQQASEAFMTWYLDQMKSYWQKGLLQALPVRKSIVDLPEFQKDANMVKAVKEWQPVAKTFAAKSTKIVSSLNAVDGGQAFTAFAQQVVQGETDPKTALATLQKGIESVM
ncbi:multiple sugar transport system substrate-binding protein [Pseudarthrobacter siccitolerans]|uniref:Multiple sugar transport system substrate-binding protein n=2 Tax=Micrococcaceae TaxID=1268 RepID=A0ABU0PNP7_9MICC|nr:extracellular solute-binding protein [Pseudarthrobacter siccitolerans]MDQ0675152.1 multiple sugar transport system substrate-binding protein [Pseudarthrobacter siccitolerans]